MGFIDIFAIVLLNFFCFKTLKKDKESGNKRKRNSLEEGENGTCCKTQQQNRRKRRKTSTALNNNNVSEVEATNQDNLERGISDLPPEVQQYIFSMLPVPCLLSVSRVCKNWR